jgi:Ni/Fe-hydrogenase subunit HybB-like protein
MLIWYANVGEETTYFKTRIDEYPVLFYGNLIINFLVPFFVLMRNDTKRKYGTLMFVSIVLILGHWWDFFLMLKPGILHTAHEAAGMTGDHGGFTAGFTMPGLIELGTMVGFLSLFLFVVFTVLSRNTLLAKNDPFLEESLHHHV